MPSAGEQDGLYGTQAAGCGGGGGDDGGTEVDRADLGDPGAAAECLYRGVEAVDVGQGDQRGASGQQVSLTGPTAAVRGLAAADCRPGISRVEALAEDRSGSLGWPVIAARTVG
jgi:hypothetical protein